jgi:hypothetical protein
MEIVRTKAARMVRIAGPSRRFPTHIRNTSKHFSQDRIRRTSQAADACRAHEHVGEGSVGPDPRFAQQDRRQWLADRKPRCRRRLLGMAADPAIAGF